jgi:hypothetical protein
MTEETTEETSQTKEESDFETFTSSALRSHRKGSFETLLAQHLAVATPSDPLNKIRLVCEAAFMVPKDKLELDMKQVETVYMVCLSFLNATRPDIIMAFGFALNEESYVRFIKPWHEPGGVPMMFTSFCEADRQEKSEEVENAKTAAEAFFLVTARHGLSSGSFAMLKAEFLRYAIPHAMETFEKISKLVDPDLYKELLGLLRPEAKTEK